MTNEEADIYPDFVTIAGGFGVPAKRVRRPDELRAAIREMLVCAAACPAEHHVLQCLMKCSACNNTAASVSALHLLHFRTRLLTVFTRFPHPTGHAGAILAGCHGAAH